MRGTPGLDSALLLFNEPQYHTTGSAPLPTLPFGKDGALSIHTGETTRPPAPARRGPLPLSQIQFMLSERILDLVFGLGEPTIFIWIVSFPMTSRKATRRSMQAGKFLLFPEVEYTFKHTGP